MFASKLDTDGLAPFNDSVDMEACPLLPTDVQWDIQYPIVPLGDLDKLFLSHIITIALLPILSVIILLGQSG